MSLSVQDCNVISLRRPAQRDLFISLTDYGLKNEEIDVWRGLVWTAGRSTNIRSYRFNSLPGSPTVHCSTAGSVLIRP